MKKKIPSKRFYCDEKVNYRGLFFKIIQKTLQKHLSELRMKFDWINKVFCTYSLEQGLFYLSLSLRILSDQLPGQLQEVTDYNRVH